MPYKDDAKQKAYQNQWLQDRRNAWLIANGPCVECGSWDRLEVDHIDKTQKVTHRVWSWKLERQAAELAKCQVLCFCCHKMKTKADCRVPLIHGTTAGYHARCRCELCRYAVRLDRRARREAKRQGVTYSTRGIKLVTTGPRSELVAA